MFFLRLLSWQTNRHYITASKSQQKGGNTYNGFSLEVVLCKECNDLVKVVLLQEEIFDVVLARHHARKKSALEINTTFL